jgi:hypothetical protein
MKFCFFNLLFYACLHAVRRASARQAALSYLVDERVRRGMKGTETRQGTEQSKHVKEVPVVFEA